MDDEIQTWWEIPSIVHFCKVFNIITKDISRVNINEFENAVEENSYLLTDMAIRFTQICVPYDTNTSEWWNIMKELFRSKCIIYNFKYSLDSAKYFDDLTRKQKVEALYIFCNFILDVKDVQDKLSKNPKIWSILNVKPLGYDLNKSVYWYFGSNKLYREDFENSFDVSTNLPVEHNFYRKIQYEPYPSGVFGSGKWNTICDNIDDWYSLADITEYSKNINIRYLHKAISNIIINLPKVNRNKSHYTYIKPLKRISLRNVRSMGVMDAECKNLITNSSVILHKQYSQNVKETQSKHRYDSTDPQYNETSNLNVHDHNQNISHSTNVFDNNIQIGTLDNNQALKLQYSIGNKKVLDKCAKHNIVFDRKLVINLKRCDQENSRNSNNFKRKLRSSTNDSSVILHKQYSQNVKETQSKHRYDTTDPQYNETSNLNVHDHNQNISHSTNGSNNNIQIGTLDSNQALKLQYSSGNKKVLDKCAKHNVVFDRKLVINLKRCDQENSRFKHFKRKLRSSTNGTK